MQEKVMTDLTEASFHGWLIAWRPSAGIWYHWCRMATQRNFLLRQTFFVQTIALCGSVFHCRLALAVS
jgi:hypothetical protein